MGRFHRHDDGTVHRHDHGDHEHDHEHHDHGHDHDHYDPQQRQGKVCQDSRKGAG